MCGTSGQYIRIQVKDESGQVLGEHEITHPYARRDFTFVRIFELSDGSQILTILDRIGRITSYDWPVDTERVYK